MARGKKRASKRGLAASASAPVLSTRKPPAAPTPRAAKEAESEAGSVPATPRTLTPREQYLSAKRLSKPRARPTTGTPSGTQKHPGSALLQGLAVRHSAPSVGFGAASRDVANKVFVSQEHTLSIKHGTLSPGPAAYSLTPRSVAACRFGSGHRFLFCGKLDEKPGPGAYRAYSSVGNRYDSALPSAPMPTFGAASRAVANKVFISQQHTLTIRAGSQSPGPAYMLPTAVGGGQYSHPSSRIPHRPTWKMVGRARAPVDPGLDTPGPKYHAHPFEKTALGKQPDAGHRSEPSWSISTKARTPVDAGLQSPGPIYNLPSANGYQPSARHRSAPTPKFSRNSRWAALEREQRKRDHSPRPRTNSAL